VITKNFQKWRWARNRNSSSVLIKKRRALYVPAPVYTHLFFNKWHFSPNFYIFNVNTYYTEITSNFLFHIFSKIVVLTIIWKQQNLHNVDIFVSVLWLQSFNCSIALRRRENCVWPESTLQNTRNFHHADINSVFWKTNSIIFTDNGASWIAKNVATLYHNSNANSRIQQTSHSPTCVPQILRVY
jgi:hypothetical protein